jgi:hypothetical protein
MGLQCLGVVAHVAIHLAEVRQRRPCVTAVLHRVLNREGLLVDLLRLRVVA